MKILLSLLRFISWTDIEIYHVIHIGDSLIKIDFNDTQTKSINNISIFQSFQNTSKSFDFYNSGSKSVITQLEEHYIIKSNKLIFFQNSSGIEINYNNMSLFIDLLQYKSFSILKSSYDINPEIILQHKQAIIYPAFYSINKKHKMKRETLKEGYSINIFGLLGAKLNRSEKNEVQAFVDFHYTNEDTTIHVRYGIDDKIMDYGDISFRETSFLILGAPLIDDLAPGSHHFYLIITYNGEDEKRSEDFELIRNPPRIALLKDINQAYIKPDKIQFNLYISDIDKSGKGSLYYRIDEGESINSLSNIDLSNPSEHKLVIETKNLTSETHTIQIWVNDRFYDSNVVIRSFSIQKFPDINIERPKLVYYYRTVEILTINYNASVENNEYINLLIHLDNAIIKIYTIDKSGRYSLNQSLNTLSIGNHSIIIEMQNQFFTTQQGYNIQILPNRPIISARIDKTKYNNRQRMITVNVSYQNLDGEGDISIFYSLGKSTEPNIFIETPDSEIHSKIFTVEIPKIYKSGDYSLSLWATSKGAESEKIVIPFKYDIVSHSYEPNGYIDIPSKVYKSIRKLR